MADSPKKLFVLETIRKHPQAANMVLARKLYAEAPEMWTTLEACRSSVRRYRGNDGVQNRSGVKGLDTLRPNAVPGNPFLPLPEPLDNFGDSEPHVLRSAKTLIMADIHAPYHNRRALEIAIETGIKENVEAVILNGDALDFFSISRWQKDPRLRDLPREIEIGRELLGSIRTAFSGKEIIFKDGNHEERWFSYLYLKAPELLGVNDFEIEKIFRFDELGIKRLTKRQHIRIGDLNVMHGHEFGRSIISPVNAARGLFLRAKASAIIGHYHQSAEHVEKNVNDSQIGCWSTGCLCDLRPDYARYNKWNHGFAIVSHEVDSAYFRVENLKIIDGRIV